MDDNEKLKANSMMIKDEMFPAQEKISVRREVWCAKTLRKILRKGDVASEQMSKEV